MALKEQYKKLTGTDHKPSNAAPSSSSSQKENKKPAVAAAATAASSVSAASGTSGEADQLVEKIAQQGDKVRELKSNKSAPKVSQTKILISFSRELAISSDDL